MLLTAAAIYGVSASGVFGIERLEIDKLRYTEEAAVRAVLDGVTGENLFQVRTEPLVENLRRLPTILDARLEVSLPDTLIVRITERTPILIWRVGETAYLADEAGILFSTLDAAPDDATVGLLGIVDDRAASGGVLRLGTVLDQVDFDAARRLAGITPGDVGSVAASLAVTITDASAFVVSTRPGSWVAIFGFYTPTLRPPDLIPGQVRLLRSLLDGREDEIARVILADDKNGTYVPHESP